MMLPKHISLSISALAISGLLLFGFLSAPAQTRKKNVVTPVDTTAFFQGMAVSVDLIGVAQTLLSDYGQYEAALRINLKDKYFPIIELGYGTADVSDEATNLLYKTNAPYGRIGVDWNLMKNKHDIYRLYGGFRYGFTSYKFDVSGPDVTDPVWGGSTPYDAHGISANYHWLEGVFGVDAKIWGPIRMGWSVRYRRRLFHDDGTLGNTYYVPGYGKQGGSRFGGTFNIGFEL